MNNLSSVPESLQIPLLNDGFAANAELAQPPPLVAVVAVGVAGTTRAWDPYEIWLRRIKEPRDRRRQDKSAG